MHPTDHIGEAKDNIFDVKTLAARKACDENKLFFSAFIVNYKQRDIDIDSIGQPGQYGILTNMELR